MYISKTWISYNTCLDKYSTTVCRQYFHKFRLSSEKENSATRTKKAVVVAVGRCKNQGTRLNDIMSIRQKKSVYMI